MKSRKWRFKIIYIIKLFAHINIYLYVMYTYMLAKGWTKVAEIS